MNPIYAVFDEHKYDPWDSKTREIVKTKILLLGIDGLMDVKFTDTPEGNVRVTPVFATEKDYMWYNLKYNV